MNLHNFNFSQPLWLWALLLIPTAWLLFKLWRHKKHQHHKLDKLIDKKLLPHILVYTPKAKLKNNKGITLSGLVACLIIALANPRWSFTEVDTYNPTASLVVLLDLSSAMDVQDVKPSRIVQARQTIEDLLNASSALRVGLIGFAANPHLISPITDDLKTIKSFLPVIDTDLISKQGDILSTALDSAAELLIAEPGKKKSILLVSAGNFADRDYMQKIHSLVKNNIQVYVLGIGTLHVTPYKNEKILQNIAKQGQGLYLEPDYAGHAIKTILLCVQQQNTDSNSASGKIRQWNDRYYLLLLPAAVLLLRLFTQSGLSMLAGVFILSILNINDAQAFEISSWFKNSSQLGKEHFAQKKFDDAAEKFNDPYHKGVALYRAGKFSEAEQQFAQVKRSNVQNSALYNSGNAQMQQQKWQQAVNSYQQFLTAEPDNSDAKFNLALAQKMLEENPSQQDDQESENQDSDQQNPDKKHTTDTQDQQDQNKQGEHKKSKQEKQNDKINAEEQEMPDQTEKDKQQQELMPVDEQSAMQEERAQQWLNRINSDIKVFLKRKFYVEDMLS